MYFVCFWTRHHLQNSCEFWFAAVIFNCGICFSFKTLFGYLNPKNSHQNIMNTKGYQHWLRTFAMFSKDYGQHVQLDWYSNYTMVNCVWYTNCFSTGISKEIFSREVHRPIPADRNPQSVGFRPEISECSVWSLG